MRSDRYQESLNSAYQIVNEMVRRSQDDRETGFVSCEYKKDLLQLLWHIEDSLERCPNFGDIEDKWQQERTLTLLKKQNYARSLD